MTLDEDISLSPDPKLANSLRQNRSLILETWQKQVVKKLEGAKVASQPVLLDHLPNFLDAVANALEKGQSKTKDISYCSREHGRQRAQKSEYSLNELIYEYQIFRAVVFSVIGSYDVLSLEQTTALLGIFDQAIRFSVTEFEQNATENLRYVHSAMQASGVGAFEWFFKDDQLCWSEAANEIFGFAPGTKALTGQAVLDRIFDEDQAAVQAALQLAIQKKSEFFSEYRIKHPDGSFRWVMAKGEVAFDELGEPFCLRGTNMDISDLKNADNQLHVMVDALQEQKRLRENFVNTLTHDLRTPLTAARLSSEMISRAPEKKELAYQFSQRIIRNMRSADKMIQDLLDANKIEAGQALYLELQEFDMVQAVSHTIDVMRSIFGNRFHLEAPPTLRGVWWAQGIERILENLLSNAVKYGDGEKPITVRIKDMQDQVELSVHNEGVPIPVDKQARLFEPYQRLTEHHHSFIKGWGLGLTVVKGFAEAHGGHIRLKSSLEEGTTFFVEVPRMVENKVQPPEIY